MNSSVGPVLHKYFSDSSYNIQKIDNEEFFKEWKRAKKNKKIRRELVSRCIPLAVSMARRYYNKVRTKQVLTFDDLIQQAFLIVNNKILLWPHQKVPFITWMSRVIHRDLWMWTFSQRIIYIPKDVIFALKKEAERQLSLTEQVEILKHGDDAAIRSQQIPRLHDWGNKHATNIGRLVKNYRIALDNDLSYCLADVEKLLPLCVDNPRTREIFSRKYGLAPYNKSYKIEEICNLFNITHQTFYYHVFKAIQLMRDYVYPKAMVVQNCALCGEEFPKSNKGKKYCSLKCKRKVQQDSQNRARAMNGRKS